ncbi:MAG: Flp pilus assembly protein CpaB [Nitrospinota bacterium]
MNRKRALLILLLGVISGLAATIGASRYLTKAGGRGPEVAPVKVESVVIASTDVEKGETLRRQHLAVVSWPAELVPPSTLRKIEHVENRVTFVDLLKGEPILEAKLAPPGSPPGLGGIIAPGMRAVTVRVDDVIGVAGFLLPGSRVDVLTTMDVRARKGKQDTITRVVLQDINVLAVGQKMKEVASKPEKGMLREKITVVTLLVTPFQSERLTLASTRGKILLALRNTADRESIDTPGVSPPELIFGAVAQAPKPNGQKKIQKAPKPPEPEKPSVEVIRGGKRSHETFDGEDDK